MPSTVHRWYALALICIGQFMVVLDVSIVNVALPSIQEDLGFSQADLQWVISAYTLMAGGFPPARRARRGHRRAAAIFMLGLALFSAGSLLCGLAWSEGALIFARGVQGLGAAFVAPAALSLIFSLFEKGPDTQHGARDHGAISGSGAAFGVLLGGILTEDALVELDLLRQRPVGIATIIATTGSSPRARATSATASSTCSARPRSPPA